MVDLAEVGSGTRAGAGAAAGGSRRSSPGDRGGRSVTPRPADFKNPPPELRKRPLRSGERPVEGLQRLVRDEDEEEELTKEEEEEKKRKQVRPFTHGRGQTCGERVQILTSRRGVVKICSGRRRNVLFRERVERGNFLSK